MIRVQYGVNAQKPITRAAPSIINNDLDINQLTTERAHEAKRTRAT
jgi:hypothetical protein